MKPEQVKVAVALDTGGVAIMSVVLNDGKNVVHDPTPEYVNALIEQSRQAGSGWGGNPVSWRFIRDDELSLDRTYRAAWEDTGSLAVNMPRARAIHMDLIRAARTPFFKALDDAYLRADEAGDTARKRQVAAQKQALRDLPTTFDLSGARTPEELKALWPQELS